MSDGKKIQILLNALDKIMEECNPDCPNERRILDIADRAVTQLENNA